MRQARRDEWAELRQDAHIGGREGADREIAGPTVCGLLREPAGVLDTSQDVLCFAQEDPTGVGQRDVTPAAIEQRDAHRRFELPDLLAE